MHDSILSNVTWWSKARAGFIGLLLGWMLSSGGIQPAAAAEPGVPRIDFAREVKPILEARCINCHGRGRSKGGFKMDTRDTLLEGGNSGAAVVPGKSSESLLVRLVSGEDPDSIMPQKGSRLTGEQVALLRRWIDEGAPWDPTVSFARREPLNLHPTPERLALGGDGTVNPIDRILAQYWTTNGIPGAPNAQNAVSDRIYARRVFLDMVGLLPSEAELKAFMEDDWPGKRTSLVKRLLEDKERYAGHWLTFWNDLLRNDYRGTGYIDGGRKQITGWLYWALRTNMPYDQFSAQLVNPPPEAEGFTKGIVWRGVVNASQTPEMQAAQNIGQVFMGVNLKCASCHDSFINDWRLSEAYGLAAVYHDGPLEIFRCDKPTGEMAAGGFIFPELGTIDAKATRKDRLVQLANVLASPKDGRLTRTIVNRLWAKFLGRGLVEPVDEMDQPAWCQELLDWLAEDLAVHGYNLKRTMEQILVSRAYQLPAVDLGEAAGKGYVFRGPAIRRLTAEQFRDALGQVTGVWHDKAEFTPPKDGEREAPGDIRASLVAADPLTTALGRPNREQVVTTRPSAATTLQALEFTNGETLAEVLRAGAQRLTVYHVAPEALVDSLYQRAFGRAPTTEERGIAKELIGTPVSREGIEDLVWAIAMSPEFQLVY